MLTWIIWISCPQLPTALFSRARLTQIVVNKTITNLLAVCQVSLADKPPDEHCAGDGGADSHSLPTLTGHTEEQHGVAKPSGKRAPAPMPSRVSSDSTVLNRPSCITRNPNSPTRKLPGRCVASMVGRFSMEGGMLKTRQSPSPQLSTLTGESTVADILSRIQRDNNQSHPSPIPTPASRELTRSAVTTATTGSDKTAPVSSRARHSSDDKTSPVSRRASQSSGDKTAPVSRCASQSSGDKTAPVSRRASQPSGDKTAPVSSYARPTSGDKTVVSVPRRRAVSSTETTQRSRKTVKSAPPAWTWSSPVYSAKPSSGPSIVPIRQSSQTTQPGPRHIARPSSASRVMSRIPSATTTSIRRNSSAELSTGRRRALALPPPSVGPRHTKPTQPDERAAPGTTTRPSFGRRPVEDPAFTTAHEHGLRRQKANTVTSVAIVVDSSDDVDDDNPPNNVMAYSKARQQQAKFQPTREIRIPPSLGAAQTAAQTAPQKEGQTPAQTPAEQTTPNTDEMSVVSTSRELTDSLEGDSEAGHDIEKERKATTPRKTASREDPNRFVLFTYVLGQRKPWNGTLSHSYASCHPSFRVCCAVGIMSPDPV